MSWPTVDTLLSDPYQYVVIENGHHSDDLVETFEVYVDELVVPTAPVGCD